MDKLVAQYSRQTDQNEFHTEQEQDLTEGLPPLSLKFSLPPVDNVSVDCLRFLCVLGARWRCDRGRTPVRNWCPSLSAQAIPQPSTQLDDEVLINNNR